MRIIHKHKKIAPVHPQVTEFINNLLATSKNDLPGVLGAIDVWAWPRSDLNAWIRVLNQFDAILEDIVVEYDLDGLQTRGFTEQDKSILSEILRFERLLLENTTNRKSFNSYDRINSLLFTSDLDVLILALNLLLRPAQQYSAQQSVAQALNISTSRLTSLARRWTTFREFDIGLVDLVTAKGKAKVDELPAETREVVFSFYRKDDATTSDSSKDKEEKTGFEPVDVFKTPVRKPSTSASAQTPSAASTSRASTGPVEIRLSASAIESKSAMELLSEAISTHLVPAGEQFELLCRLRAARALLSGSLAEDERVKLVTARLLALAIFCHTHGEAQANTALFLYEPDLTAHVAELLQLDRGVPMPVQTAALAALDALARYRGRITEVLGAVNAGVAHGILMAMLRHTVTEIAATSPTAEGERESESSPPHAFLDALLSFITFLAQNAAGGSMLVSAGLVPLLITLVENRAPARLTVVSKTMQLLDIVLYGFVNAFALFVGARGVDTLVGRISHEIDCDIAEGGDTKRAKDVALPYGHLSVARASVLKHSLRSMHRMMQSSGTSEGLRGLIDSSLLPSIKKIIENRALFGPSILSIAINMMATFVHNEPTCLTIIQESGLPQAFYAALEHGLEPMIEVIQAVPNAIGALCLNADGIAQLSSRPSIIPGIFSIFTSDRHLRVLADKENALLIGTTIDELVRHHPTLKSHVLDSIRSTMSTIEEMGNAYVPPKDQTHWYMLLPTAAGGAEGEKEVVGGMEDVMMGEPEAETGAIVIPAGEAAPAVASTDDKENTPEENLSSSPTNNIVTFIDILARFLEGFFQHHLHCDDFVHQIGGLESLGRMTALPCMPFDYGNSLSSDSLVQVFRTLSDASTAHTLPFLSRIVQQSLEQNKAFWEKPGGSSKLADMIEFSDDSEEAQNQRYRKLITLQTRITLLSEVYSTAGYTSGRTAYTILQALLGPAAPRIVPDLGALHRACIWENIVLRRRLPDQPSGVTALGVGGQEEQAAAEATLEHIANGGGEAASTSTVAAEGDTPMNIESSNAVIADPAHVSQTQHVEESNKNQAEPSDACKKNSHALKHVLTQVPAALAPLFQAAVKLFTTNPRRTVEEAHKKLIFATAPDIADVIIKHVSFDDEVEDELTLSAYWTIALGMLTVLLVDERNDDQSLHTILVWAFYKQGGLAPLLAIGDRFIATIERIGKVGAGEQTDTSKEQLVCSYAGMKVLLHLLQPLVSSRLIFEASQTILLSTNGKKEGEKGYFNAHEFLVQLRTAILPFTRKVWESQWLLEAPQGVIKSVAHIVLELVKAENEEVKEGGPQVPTVAPQAFVLDETRVTAITDMGFSRSAARRALTRGRNNVAAATEMLISQPYLFPELPDEPDEPEVNQEMRAASDDDEAAPVAVAEVAEEVKDETPVKTLEQWRAELKLLREPLQEDVGRFALRIVDAHPGLIFEVQALFIGPLGSPQEPSIRRLIEDIKTFSPAAYDVQEQPMAVRCRLLALTLSHPGSQDIVKKDAKTLMDSLLALLLSKPVQTDVEHQPKWLAAHLLVAEALLMLGEQPRGITLPAEGEPIEPQTLHDGSLYPEARGVLFNTCMNLVTIPMLMPAELLSSLRMLVLLTREHKYAMDFVKRGGPTSLMACLRQGERENDLAIKSHIIIIIRHVVEDHKTLQGIMQHAFKRFFQNPKTRTPDVANFVRGCSAVALRDPAAFVEAASAVATLSRPYGAPQYVKLKTSQEAEAKPASADETKASEVAMQIDVSLSHVEALEPLVHGIIKEVFNSTKAVFDGHSSTETSLSKAETDAPLGDVPIPLAETNILSTQESKTSDPKAEQAYASYALQALTELLFSYDSCKLAFLAYSDKKRTQTPSKEKSRSTALHYILYDLINADSIEPKSSSASDPKANVTNWAMSVIVALCVDTSHVPDMKDLSADVISVRKVVLDGLSRAFKDASAISSIQTRYGRLMVLSDLVHRLLIVRPHYTTKKTVEDTPTHLAKLMLEKNYVATLTNALGDVDLNYPQVKHLVTAILKPLELLSRIAIKMSRSLDKEKETLEVAEEEPAESSDEDEDEESEPEEGREETPDLYRNSALGMFSGEMEDAHFTPQDDMDDEEGLEVDEDVDMEYGEETASEDTSPSEMEDEEIMVAPALDAGDWEDQDDEDGDDDDDVDPAGDPAGGQHDEDEDDAEDDEDQDDDDGGDEEGGDLWQAVEAAIAGGDLDGELAVAGVAGDEDDDGAEFLEDQANGDDADIMSDPEGLDDDGAAAAAAHGGDTLDDDDGYELVGDVPHNVSAFQSGFPIPIQVIRRNANGTTTEVNILSQSPNPPTISQDVVTHPLLFDNAPTAHNATSSQSRSRRTQRNNDTLHNVQQEIIQSIQDTLGTAAVQVFQRLMMNRHGITAIRAPIDLTDPMAHAARSGRGATRDNRPTPRAFEPLLTSHRWSEEARMLYGRSAMERLIRLQNHTALAMLPSAVEAAAVAEAKRKEEEAEAARKAEEEAEAARKKEEEEEATRKVAEEEAAALRKDDEPVSGTDALASTKSELPLTASDDKDEAMTVEPKPEELAQTGQEDNSIAGIPVSNDSQDQPTNVGSASGSTETDAIPETSENRTTHEGQDMDQEMADVTPAIEQPAAPATENSDEVEPQPPAPGASTEHQRVTIMIHGNPVDITDTGIDLDFLEALPDEMREEVVNQHVSAQRAARVTRPADSQISTEFLDALPPEIRAEIIQQETLERASRAPPAPVAAPGGTAAVLPTAMAADIDPASFIASLDPQLRQVIMMEQDDGFIQSLPPHMLAEANAFREARRHHVPRDRAPQTPPAGRKPASARDSIQLVDKTGISVLVRLLFFPHALRKSLLLKALLNLCENGKTRTELLTLLTNILQDGTGDVAAIDKSFAQLSFGNVKSPGPMTPMTPKAIGKQRAIDSLTALALPSHEAVPELVAQRSLEALSYVVSHNDRSAVFFLTQHEMSSSLKRSLSKKGKGKEKQATTHYPIVSLLGLLDRRAFLKTTSITEGVVGLLAVVTRPLSTIPPVKDKLETVPATSSSTDSAQASTSVEPTTVPIADASQPSVTVPVDAENKEQPPEAKTEEEPKGLITAPPQIPASVLRLVVNILTMGECSGRTFQNTLALIQHLSAIPETREIIAQELREKAQESGHSIQEELYELATALNDSTTDVLVNSAMTKFSLASSEQAKLLRILKTLDYMFTHKSSSADKSSETNIDQVQGIYESFNFAPLWARLGSCLTVIEEHTELEHVATVLLPLIEALMVVCKHVGVASTTGTRTILPGSSPRAPTTPRESMEDLFVAFTDSHRKILNLMVRNNPSLMSGSFSLLVHNPRVLDFDNKRNYFNQQLRRRTPSRDHHGTLQVNVRRARVFEESFQSLQRKTAEQMKYGKLSVRFYDEEGVDAGGLTREWFQILARQMFDPNYALFQPCVADKLTYQPNQASWVNPEHLSFFKFVGRVIGKAIFDGRLLDAYFARSFYRQLLGKTTDYRDVEWVDPEYYNSLCWILENDPEVLDMNFSVEADEFGVMKQIPLKEGGASISVTNENKKEFVQLSAQHRLYDSIKDQIEALLAGFYDIIPKELISIFNEQEVELLISGTPDIDVDEWRAATEYHNYTGSDTAIVWWWRALKSFNREERAKVLSFATGTSRVPLSGFGDLQGVQGVQKFSIHRAFGASDRLPQAHTCFNQIDLPEYTTYEKLRQQLLFAINEGGEGFGFA